MFTALPPPAQQTQARPDRKGARGRVEREALPCAVRKHSFSPNASKPGMTGRAANAAAALSLREPNRPPAASSFSQFHGSVLSSHPSDRFKSPLCLEASLRSLCFLLCQSWVTTPASRGCVGLGGNALNWPLETSQADLAPLASPFSSLGHVLD